MPLLLLCLYITPLHYKLFANRPSEFKQYLFVFYETKVFIEGSLTSQTIPSPYSIYKINSPLRLHQLLSHYLQPQNPRMLQCQCSSEPSYLIQSSSFAQAISY